MSTIDMLNPTTGGNGFAGKPNDFALWRLRADALYFRPEAWKCVERLKSVCADEAREHRDDTVQTVAAFCL